MPTTVTLMYQWVIISILQSVKKKYHVIINYYNNRKKTISITIINKDKPKNRKTFNAKIIDQKFCFEMLEYKHNIYIVTHEQ